MAWSQKGDKQLYEWVMALFTDAYLHHLASMNKIYDIFLFMHFQARRKTATPEDLLYAHGNTSSVGPSPAGLTTGVTPMGSVPETPEADHPPRYNGTGPDATLMPPPPSIKVPTRVNGVPR